VPFVHSTSESEEVDESDDYIDVHHPLPINFNDEEEYDDQDDSPWVSCVHML
jgi:hypothetical protein